MTRKLREFEVGRPYHVIVRANNGRRLFSYPNEYGWFLYLVGQSLKRVPIGLSSYVLMTNHVHFELLPDEEKAVSQFIKLTCQRYAQSRNQRRSQTGRLFDERYYSKAIKDDRQLAATTAYIEANPVRAGIVEHPRDYPWSSYAFHAGIDNPRLPRKLLTPSAWYLSLHDRSTVRAAIYSQWFDELAESYRPDEDAAFEPTTDLRLRRPDGKSAA